MSARQAVFPFILLVPTGRAPMSLAWSCTEPVRAV